MSKRTGKTLTREELDHVGESIITIKGTNRCLGSLLYLPPGIPIVGTDKSTREARTLCPENGQVPISREEAEVHNKALDEAFIKGLDSCEVGQGNMFYYHDGQVQTFSGLLVSARTRTTGRVRKTVWLSRNGKQYRGVLRNNIDFFFLKRVK